MSDIELKPCPFCGSRDLVIFATIAYGSTGYHTPQVWCRDCHAMVVYHGHGIDYQKPRPKNNDEYARRIAELWNRRAK